MDGLAVANACDGRVIIIVVIATAKKMNDFIVLLMIDRCMSR
jgi:hypothetical protein